MDDSKKKTLSEYGVLNPTPEKVNDMLFLENDFFDPRDLIQVKYEMVRRVHIENHSVAGAVESFGFTRPTFYKVQALLAQEGLTGLIPKKRGPRGRHKLTVAAMIFVEKLIENEPLLRPEQIIERLEEEFDLKVHQRSVERALAANKKKLQAKTAK